MQHSFTDEVTQSYGDDPLAGLADVLGTIPVRRTGMGTPPDDILRAIERELDKNLGLSVEVLDDADVYEEDDDPDDPVTQVRSPDEAGAIVTVARSTRATPATPSMRAATPGRSPFSASDDLRAANRLRRPSRTVIVDQGAAWAVWVCAMIAATAATCSLLMSPLGAGVLLP